MGTIANACIIEKRNIAAIHKGHLKRDAHTHTHRDTQRAADCDMRRRGGVGNPYGEGPRHLGPRSTKPNNRCNARSLAIRASACASFGSKRTRVTERVTTGTRQAGTARGKWWGVGSANSIVAGLPMGANNERDTQPQSTLDSSLVPLFFIFLY